MSGFYIYDHYPSINEIDVPRNPTIKVYFNQALALATIDYKVISIHDSLYASVPGTASQGYTDAGTPSGVANVLKFTPTVLLNADSKYSVFIHKGSNSVLSSDNDALTDTYKFTFFTGSGTVAISDPTALEQLEIDLEYALDIENYALADELQELIDVYGSGVLPSGLVEAPVATETLKIEGTYPDDKQANVQLTDLKFIKIELNDAPDISGVAMNDYINIEYRKVLN